MSTSTPSLNENEKKQIFANELEEKSISFIGRKLSRSRTVERNYLKFQMQLDVSFFEKLLKDNQAQKIFKNL